MDDLISRQVALDAMNNLSDIFVNNLPPMKYATDVQEAINGLPPVDTPHWIPCSKKLPEEDGLYLVTTSKGQVQMHVFNRNGNSEEYWKRCNMAWMPLPKPYEGGEEE